MTKAELDKELENLKIKYMQEESVLRSKYEPKQFYDDNEIISFSPLKQTLKYKGISIKDMCTDLDMSYQTIKGALAGKHVPMTDKLAKIASYLQVPVSQVVAFNGYEVKPELYSKYGVVEEFKIPEEILGEPSYKPLRDLIKSFYKDKENKKTISDLFDKIEPTQDKRQEFKGNSEALKKALIKRGIDLNNPKHEKFARPGLSSKIRGKILHDKTVNTHLIYKICKLLQCNVDFVFGWK